MARRRSESLADYYRRHGEELRLARELGCTPAEAGRVMAERSHKDSGRPLQAKLAAPLSPGLAELSDPAVSSAPPLQWWQRD